jgi:hypothetical protein
MVKSRSDFSWSTEIGGASLDNRAAVLKRGSASLDGEVKVGILISHQDFQAAVLDPLKRGLVSVCTTESVWLEH